MTIHVGLITYAIDVTPLVEGMDGSEVVWHIWEHSQNPEVNAAVDRLLQDHHIRVHKERTNRGLARSWNDFLIDAQKMLADVMIVANDDILGTQEDLLKLAQTCLDHPECGIVTAWGFNERMGRVQDNGYSLFGINRIAIEKVGYFDQNYTPIYGEDVDLSRRCALENVPFYSCTETNIYHKGSATTKSDAALTQQHQVTFPRNEAYHRLKHGGGYGQEKFLCPFDDTSLSWYISAESRENPYPGHERTDKDIVKV